MSVKSTWREDLQKIRRDKEKADEAARRANARAEKMAKRQQEAENTGILYVVRSVNMSPEELEDFLLGRPKSAGAEQEETKEAFEDEREDDAHE